MVAWWYFDSTSFPYQLLWRFSLSIFSKRDASAGACGTPRGTYRKKQVCFPVFYFFMIFLVI
jgi:hypothetical protein